MTGRLRRLVAPLTGLVGFFGLWEAYVRLASVPAYQLPPPSRILRHIADNRDFYARNLCPTLGEAALGFLVALLAGLAIGAAMGHSRFTERAIAPIAVIVQVTPIVAIAPAIQIWLGFGLKPIVAITALVCVVPFTLNTVTGLRSVDPAALEVLESLAASDLEIFRRLRVPSALPNLLAAARINVGLALVGAVLGEIFVAGADRGLGYAINVAIARPGTLFDQLWGSIFVLGLLGGALVTAVTGLERRLVGWHSTGQF
jgi:NitT/TauT family transport system permease protein